jgi:hypothetical protein
MRNLGPVLGAEWVGLGSGLLGELSHRLILKSWLHQTDPERAVDARSGWTGDCAAVYHRGDDETRVGDGK